MVEALRLADALADPDASLYAYQLAQAATELRRLSAVEAQRDALLEVLKYLDKALRQHGRQHWPEAVRVHAAIKAVEGENHAKSL
jgi:hypothetical protein